MLAPQLIVSSFLSGAVGSAALVSGAAVAVAAGEEGAVVAAGALVHPAKSVTAISKHTMVATSLFDIFFPPVFALFYSFTPDCLKIGIIARTEP
jgi:hypothetical protein